MLSKPKFRAWNKVGKFMLEWEDFIGYEIDQMAIVGNNYRIFNDNEFELSKFIGLKDKNGVAQALKSKTERIYQIIKE